MRKLIVRPLGIVTKQTKGLLFGTSDDQGGAPFDKQFSWGLSLFGSWLRSWFR